MKRFCLALDLRPDAIEAYEAHHTRVWPQVLQSIADSGITCMEIYRIETRLFMVMETTDAFSFELKRQADAANPLVQEWEALMSTFQQPLDSAKPGEKWLLMDRIFSFTS